MKNQKLNLISLRKNSIINKRSSIKTNSTIDLNLREEGPFYLLPIIDKNISNTAYQQPTSILTRYVSFHAKELIKNAKKNIQKPTFLQKIDKKFLSTDIKSRQKKKKDKYKSKTISTEANINIDILNKKEKEEDHQKKNNFYLTAQDTKDLSFRTNVNDKSNKMLT